MGNLGKKIKVRCALAVLLSNSWATMSMGNECPVVNQDFLSSYKATKSSSKFFQYGQKKYKILEKNDADIGDLTKVTMESSATSCIYKYDEKFILTIYKKPTPSHLIKSGVAKGAVIGGAMVGGVGKVAKRGMKNVEKGIRRGPATIVGAGGAIISGGGQAVKGGLSGVAKGATQGAAMGAKKGLGAGYDLGGGAGSALVLGAGGATVGAAGGAVAGGVTGAARGLKKGAKSGFKKGSNFVSPRKVKDENGNYLG